MDGASTRSATLSASTDFASSLRNCFKARGTAISNAIPSGTIHFLFGITVLSATSSKGPQRPTTVQQHERRQRKRAREQPGAPAPGAYADDTEAPDPRMNEGQA